MILALVPVGVACEAAMRIAAEISSGIIPGAPGYPSRPGPLNRKIAQMVMNFRAFFIILLVVIGLLWIRAMDAGLY